MVTVNFTLNLALIGWIFVGYYLVGVATLLLFAFVLFRQKYSVLKPQKMVFRSLYLAFLFPVVVYTETRDILDTRHNRARREALRVQ